MSDEPSDREKVTQSLEVSKKVCTEFECDFLDSLSRWKGEYTVKQKAVLEKIWKKVCDSPF
jgi:hypothetical protein